MNPFTYMFEEIETLVEFNAEWCNGTGYFDHAVSGVKLAPGERAKSVADDGRRLVFVGTRLGTVVMFERYSPKRERRSDIIVTNTPSGIRDIVPNGALDEDTQWAFLGRRSNIGTILENLAKVLKV